MNLSDHAKQLALIYSKAQVHQSAAVEAHDVAVTLSNAIHYPVYADIVKRLGSKMPWWFVACLHYRENSQLSFRAYLGNGELIIGSGRKSHLVPAGHGPFHSFQDGAVDAIKRLNLQDADDWTVGAVLERFEIWNGLGYFYKKVVNPYLFSGTSAYVSGKFVADHHYDPKIVDKQIGIATILKSLGVA